MAALDFSMTLARSWRARSQKSRDQNATSFTGTMTRLLLPSSPVTCTALSAMRLLTLNLPEPDSA